MAMTISTHSLPQQMLSTPPSSPTKAMAQMFLKITRERSPKSHHIESTSGEPHTDPSLAAEGVTSPRKVPVEHTDQFLCLNAVDVERLLRGSRTSLLAKAQSFGATCLVSEQWWCTICGPKHDSFRVTIRYSALATRSEKPDPRRPVCIGNAKGIPGLMTILERE